MTEGTPTMITALIILLALSGFFSASETAFSSLNVIRLKNWAEDGDRQAQRALELHEDYDRLLSAVLIGNNIVNIAAASIGTVLFTLYFPGHGATLSTVVITLAVLIFSEVTPKSMAKARPERFAMAVAPAVGLLMKLFFPLTFLFNAWTTFIQKLMKREEDTGITGDELITMVSEAEQEGGIDEDESELIRSAIEFGDRIAEEILIPRVDVVMVEDTASLEEVEHLFLSSDYSRLPVYHDNLDNVLGYIHIHDLYRLHREGRTDWLNILTPVVYASHTEQIYDLLQSLQRQKAHMAIVVDAYGGTMGIVTMEDILEELVGEIWDEHDEVVEEFKKQPDGSYLIACSADLNDVFKLFELKDDCEASTVSGWVVEELGHVPVKGDTFRYENLKVTVTNIHKLRVLEIRVEVLPEEEQKEE
ncbi:MAG: HlyC/CorC family transporter [Oscillospiraceae bacterium]|nr:HlyC/CorC family transporter [Oscillospiraceae bacterium]MBR1845768.1 HlyC/CorC family transporter [Oscillospiraceae bacterium]